MVFWIMTLHFILKILSTRLHNTENTSTTFVNEIHEVTLRLINYNSTGTVTVSIRASYRTCSSFSRIPVSSSDAEPVMLQMYVTVSDHHDDKKSPRNEISSCLSCLYIYIERERESRLCYGHTKCN